jgi:hypothetical protein
MTISSAGSPPPVLSAGAQGLAALNAAGVTVTVVPYSAGSLAGGNRPPGLPGGGDGSISQASFQSVLQSYGATQQEAARIFAAADTGGGTSLSNRELLTELGSTASSSSTTSQELLRLMDANHDGSVSSSEYLNFETSLVEAETAAT